MRQTSNGLKVFFLSSEDPANGPLKDILAAHTEIKTVYSLAQMLTLMDRDRCDVLLCDWNFQDGTWRDARRRLLERHLELPMIVVYHSGSEPEWVEVLEAGAYDLLSPPYRGTEILSSLKRAAGSPSLHCKHNLAAPAAP